MCPENPNTEKFKAGSDIVFSQLTMDALKKGQTHDLGKESVSFFSKKWFCENQPVSVVVQCK